MKNEKYSSILAHLTLFGAIACPVFAIGVWIYWDQLALVAFADLVPGFNLAGLSTGERVVGCGLTLTGALIRSYGLLGLRQTFMQATSGTVLSEKGLQGFRQFAWVTLIMVLFGIVQRTGLIMLFSLSDPAHQGRLDIQLGSDELGAFFIGLLLVFVARVFAEGKQAKDENDTFL